MCPKTQIVLLNTQEAGINYFLRAKKDTLYGTHPTNPTANSKAQQRKANSWQQRERDGSAADVRAQTHGYSLQTLSFIVNFSNKMI